MDDLSLEIGSVGRYSVLETKHIDREVIWARLSQPSVDDLSQLRSRTFNGFIISCGSLTFAANMGGCRTYRLT